MMREMRWSEAKCKDLQVNRQEVIDCSGRNIGMRRLKIRTPRSIRKQIEKQEE